MGDDTGAGTDWSGTSSRRLVLNPTSGRGDHVERAHDLAAEFGFRQALLVLSGTGLDGREHVFETVTRLFTDDEFLERIRAADDVGVGAVSDAAGVSDRASARTVRQATAARRLMRMGASGGF